MSHQGKAVNKITGKCSSPMCWCRCRSYDMIDPAAMIGLVSKPEHYTSHPSGIECIQITRHHNFCVGNAIKYLWRQGLKAGEPSVKDLRKAIQYIEFEIKRLETEKDD
jgi:Protein of unknwon function (DUF3310)